MLLKNGNGESSHLETTAWPWLQDSCSVFHTPPLTLLLLLLLLKQNSGLDYCWDRKDKVQRFPCQTHCASTTSPHVCGAHIPWTGSSAGTRMIERCRQSHPLGLPRVCQPLL